MRTNKFSSVLFRVPVDWYKYSSTIADCLQHYTTETSLMRGILAWPSAHCPIHVTQTTCLLGLHFYAWIVFDNVYKCTKFEACILYPCLELFNAKNTVILKSNSRSLEMASFNRSHTSSYWRSIVTMALFYIISEIKQDTGRKSPFSYPTCIRPPTTPVRGSRVVGLSTRGWKGLRICSVVSIEYTNVTDRQTDIDTVRWQGQRLQPG